MRELITGCFLRNHLTSTVHIGPLHVSGLWLYLTMCPSHFRGKRRGHSHASNIGNRLKQYVFHSPLECHEACFEKFWLMTRDIASFPISYTQIGCWHPWGSLSDSSWAQLQESQSDPVINPSFFGRYTSVFAVHTRKDVCCFLRNFKDKKSLNRTCLERLSGCRFY